MPPLAILATEAPDTEFTELGSALSDGDLSAWDFGRAGIILVVAVVVARVVRHFVVRAMNRGRTDLFLSELVGRVVAYLIIAFGFIYALDELGIAIGPLLGALGIVGIALAFALQDILENFVAGIMLQLRRPFGARDEIESVGHEGTVLAVDARTVTISTPDGETIRIPSAEVIKNPIINHTQNGRRRTSLAVGVSYTADLEQAERVILEATNGVDGVRMDPPAEAYVEEFGDSSVDFSVRFWHDPTIAARWRLRHLVALAIFSALAENEIEIPFPQRTLHLPDSSV